MQAVCRDALPGMGQGGEKLGGAAVQAGVDPAGRHFGQGGEDEAAEMGAGVGEDRVRAVADQGVDGDDVEIQGAGGVRQGAGSAGGGFDGVEAGEEPGGVGVAVQAGDGVAVVGLGGWWVSLGCVPVRDGGQGEAGQAAQRLDGGAAGGEGVMALGAGQVCADGNQDHDNVYPRLISS